jgi:hypothetical protein
MILTSSGRLFEFINDQVFRRSTMKKTETMTSPRKSSAICLNQWKRWKNYIERSPNSKNCTLMMKISMTMMRIKKRKAIQRKIPY